MIFATTGVYGPVPKTSLEQSVEYRILQLALFGAVLAKIALGKITACGKTPRLQQCETSHRNRDPRALEPLAGIRCQLK